ncbi:MAG: hypothetical protein EOM20_18730 [Spartobacteria bacterium]|nr:hypothetical protein [Spartobacteria bacterium]
MRSLFITLAYMKIIMDADCLIKLTKAGIKEDVCNAFTTFIPTRVRHEVMVNAPMHPECSVIQNNLDKGVLKEISEFRQAMKGEEAVLALYQQGNYAAIASDDKRFIGKLRILNIPFLTPGVIILLLVKQQHIDRSDGLRKLEKLSCMISDDEFAIVKLKLEALPKD